MHQPQTERGQTLSAHLALCNLCIMAHWLFNALTVPRGCSDGDGGSDAPRSSDSLQQYPGLPFSRAALSHQAEKVVDDPLPMGWLVPLVSSCAPGQSPALCWC